MFGRIGSAKTVLALVGLALVITTQAFPFGSLSEFISADGTHFRDVYNNEVVQATDIIADPKWANASFPLQLTLCTNLSSSNVKYQSSKTSELLNDIATAQNAWTFGSGSVLSFSTPTTSSSCTEGTAFDDSHRMIYFGSLPAGVLAITPSTIVAQSGKLVLTDSDIIFSNSLSFQFRTHDCDSAGSPSGNCSGGSLPVTFLGVLIHEMGHLIGISHSMINDDNSSDGLSTKVTMYPSISNLADSRANETLKLDDQLARENLYPQTSFPSGSGSVSGRVMRTASLGNRAAHIAVFDLTLNRTITGVFSSMSGSRANPDGSFLIQGIPLDTDFALFVEPVDRSADGLSTSIGNINTPIYTALSTEADGFKSFFIEAYPDVKIPDVRLNGDATQSPGFSSVQRFKLTASSPSISGLTFYLSQSKAAPNDAASASITFNVSSTITNDNPLSLTLSNALGLDLLTTAQATLTAKSATETLDWSKAIGAFTLTGSSSKITADAGQIAPADGDYTITAKLVDAKYGMIIGSQKITVKGWSGTSANSSGSSSQNSSSGCALSPRESQWSFSWLLVCCGLFFALRFYRKSLTSRPSILSRPKQS
jgi:FlaG/FlaF family flagellin (archaellin)